tara:strand:- start:22 stop:330 length:309 start_codon:yes stop_codon:yes gene_type:complete
MFTNTSNLRTKVLNTDHLGLRFNSSYNDKFTAKNIFDQKNEKNECGAIFGASTAFGFGASKDDATISSQLSKDTDVFFLQFRSFCIYRISRSCASSIFNKLF